MKHDPMRDPYEVLEVPKTATEEEIRSSYKRLALRLHPDKNKDGAEQFKEVVQAYSILSDPERRRRYDLGGFEAFKEEDLAGVEVDLSALGLVNTAMAAVFAKLGVPIKTAVSEAVMEAAYEGRFAAVPLGFGQRVQDRVDKQAARFYSLDVSQAHLDAGFIVTAYTSAGSRFKLLLFEQQADNRWELVAQEDSSKVKKHVAAGLYFIGFDTYTVGPKLSSLETVNDPESALFKRLDTFKRREQLHVRPGKLVIAVYGDNYFKRVQFTLEVVMPGMAAVAAEQVRLAERELAKKRDDLRAFETEYRRVKQQYLDACARYDREAQEVEQILGQREQAYLELLGVDDRVTAAASELGAGAQLPGRASRAGSGIGQQQQQQQLGEDAAGQQGAGVGLGAAAGLAANGEVNGKQDSRRMLGLGRLFSRRI
ncbi:hypothetical protein N2152v2_009793 [Parachlorella kessleri]